MPESYLKSTYRGFTYPLGVFKISSDMPTDTDVDTWDGSSVLYIIIHFMNILYCISVHEISLTKSLSMINLLVTGLCFIAIVNFIIIS